MDKSVWESNVGHESAFWERFLSSQEFAEIRAYRCQKILGRAHILNHVIGPHPSTSDPNYVVRVLDVGSGPLSTLGIDDPAGTVVLVRADALADDYNRLLDKYGLHDLPRIVRVKGEDLSANFGPDSFDWVNCANALDHCEDPAQTFREMVEVCKEGGLITIVSNENEGERMRYEGLHQWNLEADDEGLWLWNRTRRINLLNSLSFGDKFRWEYVTEKPKDIKVFRVEIWLAAENSSRRIRTPRTLPADSVAPKLEGRVEAFDGTVIHGWLRTGSQAELFLDDVRSSMEPRYTVAKNPNYHDFCFDIGIDIRKAPTPKIVIKYADTDIRMAVAPVAAGFINPVEFAQLDDGMPDYISGIRDLPSPPQQYIQYVGSGSAGRAGFLSIGCRTLLDLIYYGMLEGDARTIVDLGCGCGRVGLALGPYLRNTDTYIGFDTWLDGINWAREHVATRYEMLSFRSFSAVPHSRRGGYQAEKVFPLDLPDNSVDSVIAMSLFTHLRLSSASGYLHEIFRVLKPGGRAFLTWFLADPTDEPALERSLINERTEDGYFTIDETYVDAFLYEDRVLDTITELGFSVPLKHYGYWGKRPKSRLSREGQDLLLLVKPTLDEV